MGQSVRVSEFTYQRTVMGYHGCDESVVRDVFLRGMTLTHSRNDHDWLGHGIYFWEHGPWRAYEWAKAKKFRRPAVIGAIINLGNCLDLLDAAHTQLLTRLFPLYLQTCEKTGTRVPINRAAKGEAAGDKILRKLDCAVINWSLNFLKEEEKQQYHTVRGLFSEGSPIFEGSKILTKSHVQIAVRDEAAIIGYFKPRG